MASRNGFAALAGNFLQAFTQSQMLKKRSDEQEEEREARTKLFEIELKRAQEQDQAKGQVRSFASGVPMGTPNIRENPGELGGFNIGAPTPSAARGPGMSLLEMLTNPDSLMAVSESGMLPQLAAADQISARGELAQSLPGPAGLMVRSGMQLPQAGNPPESLALLQAAGIDPASPEGRSLIERRIGGDGNAFEGLQAQLMTLQAQQAQAALDKSERERVASENAAKHSTRGLLRNAKEMAEINDRLEGTLMQTGVPMTELRRGAAGAAALLEPFGFDMKKTQAAVEDFDRFNKLANQMVIDLLPKMAAAGTITDTKYDSLQSTLASTAVSPGANRLVLADIIDLGLESADTLGMSLEERQTLEDLGATLRASQQPTGGTKRFGYDPKTGTLIPK
jgi:hypothetical protein